MSGAFDVVIVVDWSGGNDTGPRPRKDAIWVCRAFRGDAGVPVYLRNRQRAFDWLSTTIAEECARGHRVLAGFDFPFGYPEGFGAALTGSNDPLALWDWFARHLEDTPGSNNRFDLAGRINARFPGTGPFWFNALARDVPGLPRLGRQREGHGLAERRLVETLAPGSFTCWQMGGAGAVGSQAMTGVAALSRLRAAFAGQLAVWPFQSPGAPVVLAEVWPSLVDEAVRTGQSDGEVRDAAQVRVLAGALGRMAQSGALSATLAAPLPEAARTEGWILGVGALDALAAAARRTRP